MNGSSERTAINVVDLFCGGGGITCGFELHAGKLQFCTVLGVDNNPAAIRIFNANFSPRAPAVLPTGRLADLTWFTHPAEIRLFYLVHCAFSRPDDELKSALERLAILDFLRDIRLCDSRFCGFTTFYPPRVPERGGVSSGRSTHTGVASGHHE